MKRYFFHIEHGQLSRDEEGTVLAHADDARAAAVRLLGELLRDQAGSFWDMPQIKISVEDDCGLVLLRLDTGGTVSASAEPEAKTRPPVNVSLTRA